MPFIAYKITHKDSGKAYIGITTRKVELRWHYHKTLGRPGIGAAIQKYGADAFTFEVIAYAQSLLDLLGVEEALIAQWGTIAPDGYNLNGGGKGHYKASELVKDKLRQRNRERVWTQESRDKVAASLRGRKMPPGFGEKVSARLLVNSPSKDPEVRKKLSETAKRRVKMPHWQEAIRKYNSTRPITPELRAKIAAGVARYVAEQRRVPGQMEMF